MHQYLDLHALGKLFSTYKLNARYETKNHYQRTTLKSLKRTQNYHRRNISNINKKTASIQWKNPLSETIIRGVAENYPGRAQ